MDINKYSDLIERFFLGTTSPEENRILFVDYWTAMANGNGGLDKDISKDGCHPTIEGYRIMEDIFLRSAKKFIR